VSLVDKNSVHKRLSTFNVLQYLTSLLLTACESAALSVNCLKIYTEWTYMQLVIFLGARSVFVVSLKLRPLYLQFFLNSKLHVLSILIARSEQGEILVWNQKKVFGFTTCTLFIDRLCGLVVRVSGYRYRGLGFDPRRYQIF